MFKHLILLELKMNLHVLFPVLPKLNKREIIPGTGIGVNETLLLCTFLSQSYPMYCHCCCCFGADDGLACEKAWEHYFVVGLKIFIYLNFLIIVLFTF